MWEWLKESFRLDIRKHLFIQRVVKHWTELSKRYLIAQAYQYLKHIWTMLLPMCFYLVSPWMVRDLIFVGLFTLKYSILFYSISLMPFFIQLILFFFPFYVSFFPYPFFFLFAFALREDYFIQQNDWVEGLCFNYWVPSTSFSIPNMF